MTNMQPLTSILSLPWVTAGGLAADLNADLSLGGLLGRVGIGLKLRIGGKDTPPPPPANDPPVAQSDTAEVRENGSLSVNASDGVIQSAQRPGSRDSDPNGDAIVVRSVKSSAGVEAAAGKALQGTYGTLTLNADGSFSYQPNEAAKALKNGERDVDTFTYTIADAKGATASTTLTIGVSGVTDGPPKLEIPGESQVVAEVIQTIRGSFSFGCPDGFGSLQIHGRVVTSEELAAVRDGSTLLVRTQYGDLVLTGVDGSPASGADVVVSYAYTSRQVQHDQSTQRALDDISVSVTDRVGMAATSRLQVTVFDTRPVADGDSRAIDEDTAGTYGRLVYSKTGDEAAYEPTEVTGKYGVFDINEQGEWAYRLFVDRTDVQALREGQQVVDVFRPALRDSDGSTELGTVVIRIFGKDEPAQTLSMSDVLESHGTIAMPQSTAAERTDGDLQGVTSPALVAESLVWHTDANELLNPVLY